MVEDCREGAGGCYVWIIRWGLGKHGMVGLISALNFRVDVEICSFLGGIDDRFGGEKDSWLTLK